MRKAPSPAAEAPPTRRDSLFRLGGTLAAPLTWAGASAHAAGQHCAPLTPAEMVGPFPADGSNRAQGAVVDVLALPGIVRRDIRGNIGAPQLKAGVPLELQLTVQSSPRRCAPLAGASVYIWQCDANGEYSGYSSRLSGDHLGASFLRGVQIADAQGQVRFTTLYPGWYRSRATHIHVQVYADGNHVSGTPTLTTQLAFPEDTTAAVYANYAKGPNTSVRGNAADMVFADGVAQQLLQVSGGPGQGYSAALTLVVAA